MIDMAKYFSKLFDYDKFTNLKLIECLNEEEKCKPSIGLMSHLLVAQQIWLKRCKGEPSGRGVLWPSWPLSDLHSIVLRNHEDWIFFLNSLDENDFIKPVVYQNSQGVSFANQLDDVLAHVINHGTHHRAQIGQQLKMHKIKLPSTDYIFYMREQSINR